MRSTEVHIVRTTNQQIVIHTKAIWNRIAI
jgi:hypothetical protein